jgi:hypothetical protein
MVAQALACDWRLAIYSGAGSQPARGSQPRFREQSSRSTGFSL